MSFVMANDAMTPTELAWAAYCGGYTTGLYDGMDWPDPVLLAHPLFADGFVDGLDRLHGNEPCFDMTERWTDLRRELGVEA